jgi:hypothetical protein
VKIYPKSFRPKWELCRIDPPEQNDCTPEIHDVDLFDVFERFSHFSARHSIKQKTKRRIKLDHFDTPFSDDYVDFKGGFQARWQDEFATKSPKMWPNPFFC